MIFIVAPYQSVLFVFNRPPQPSLLEGIPALLRRGMGRVTLDRTALIKSGIGFPTQKQLINRPWCPRLRAYNGSMIVKPKALKPGDTIGVVAAASNIKQDLLQQG